MNYVSDPIELKSGELGCPRCSTQLTEGNVPYFVNKTKVGEFDGLLCKICRYGVLSEKGYENSGKKLKELAIWDEQVSYSDDKHNLYNEPIKNSKIISDEINISRLISAKNITDEFTMGEIALEGENSINYLIEPPVITIHNKNKLRM